MSSIKDSLVSLGFDPKEASIYLHLLSHKDIPAYEIARETGIPRTTVYKTLEDLSKRGFINSWLKNGVRHFSAESPKRLQDSLNMKNEILKETLPGLLGLFSTDIDNPTTKVYLGKEGVKQAFEIMLETIIQHKVPTAYVYSDFELTELLPKYFREWRERKNKTPCFSQLIVPAGHEITAEYQSDEHRETRVMPAEFSFAGAVDIIGPKVAFFSYKDKEAYSIIIESPIVSEMLVKLFSYIWATLKPLGKNS